MGHHNRHYSGDRYANAGVWGKPTSTANFCEEDYAVTLYIAEFINTLTNLAYSKCPWLKLHLLPVRLLTAQVYFAIRYPGPRAPSKKGGPAPPPSWKHPDVFSISLWVLGALSFTFHATLKHSTQYGDELAMLVLGGALMHGSYGPRSWTAGIVSWSLVTVASALYLKTGQILHQVWAFQAMIFVVGVRTFYLILGDRRTAQGTPVLKYPTRMYLVRYAWSLATLGFGYFLWHVDLEGCGPLRELRAFVGLPWAWLLELHGWWHVLTALGASLYIRLLRDLEP
ncbi:hypothetical protein SBRCBS47491_002232 [Sporothrix bragantina]|uniref:Dihydroceramidase n=1 Tax=Sporothrix bragantina TaxID=671064 RepID=A0ABP0B5T2_9PEZI